MSISVSKQALHLTQILCLAAFAGSSSIALADPANGPTPDGHAPAGVMVDHMHKAGEWMVGYRYMYSRQAGDMLHGTGKASDHEIIMKGCGTHQCSMKPSEMNMHMHMLDIMYAPTDWLTLMVMPQWMSMDMGMAQLEGAGDHGGGDGEHGGHGAHAHEFDGIGDTIVSALVRLADVPGHHVHATFGLSIPTGSVDQKNPDGTFTHYGMQLGSGTLDFLPSLTYTGRAGPWTWGAQVSAIIRLEEANDSGYVLGDVFQATGWGSYRLTDWLSASLRVIYTEQDDIGGHYNGAHNHSSPPDLQYNYGGRFWDLGFGVNTVVREGPLKGHRLGIEWIEPIEDDVNGYQQERDGTLWVNWSKAF